MNKCKKIKNQFLNRKRINFIKGKTNKPAYNVQISSSCKQQEFITKYNLEDKRNLKDIDKNSVIHSSEDLSSSNSIQSITTCDTTQNKQHFKYKNITYKEEDLFPNQDLFSFLLGDNKQKILNSNIEQQKANNTINSNYNLKHNNNSISKQNIKNNMDHNNQTLAQKATCIAKKLRKVIIKNIKSNKNISDPEDLEYCEMVKSKRAFVETIWSNYIFLEWKLKNEQNNSLSINDKSKIINFERNFTECVICLHKFSTNNEIKLIRQCNHGFHKECLNGWLKYNNICPIDKNKLE